MASFASAQPRDPARLLASDPGDAAKLPEAQLRRSVVHRAQKGASGFNLHSYLAHYDGKFWAMWSSAKVWEEDPDQRVMYATSADGHRWTTPQVLAADPDGPEGPGRWIARSLFVADGKLSALAAYIESADYHLRGKEVVWKNLSLRRFEWSQGKWEARGVYAEDCMNNFAPVRLGNLLSLTCRDRNMAVSMALAETPPKWTRTPIYSEPPFDKMDEPTYYPTEGGEVQMIVRDNAKSGFLLRAVSKDNGRTWTRPVHTNYPDASSKNYCGRLSNGWFYLINNPNPKGRDPLAISFSKDGWTYDGMRVIRKNPPQHLAPKGPRPGSAQYPHAMEHGGSLWVIYSVNKEDIEIAEIPLASLKLGAAR